MHKSIILPFLFSLALFACSESDDQNTTASSIEAAIKTPTIALVMKSLANEFFVTMADGAKHHQINNPDQYKLIINGTKNESDIAQQVALIDQMIAAKVDAIVIAPTDSKATIPALSRANYQEGVIVVNIDNKLDSEILDDYDLTAPFVGPDNQAGARMVGKHLADRLSSGDQVAILEGIPSAYNSQQRRAGFEQAANDAKLDIVTIQSAAWDQTRAAEITSAILVQYPNIKAFFCANDNMALGAISAIQQANKTEDIQIVGFDNISAVQTLVKQGKILATVDQHADLLAVYGIEYALDMLKSKSVELIDRTTDVDLITLDSL